MDIKPIETEYNGYKFRSRLEARYARFFDALEIKYIYEPEGYKLKSGINYLPDFYLPESDQFFEVKGILNDIDKNKVINLSAETGKYVTLGFPDFSIAGCEPENGYHPCDTYLVKCNYCGCFYFENEMDYRCTGCGSYDGDSTFSYWSKANTLTKGCYDLETAYELAKRARFEFGETPKPQSIYFDPFAKHSLFDIGGD